MTMAEDPVAFDVENGIAWVRFNRPGQAQLHEPGAQPAHDGGAG